MLLYLTPSGGLKRPYIRIFQSFSQFLPYPLWGIETLFLLSSFLSFRLHLTPSGGLKQTPLLSNTQSINYLTPLWGTSLSAKCKEKGEVTLARIMHYALRIANCELRITLPPLGD